MIIESYFFLILILGILIFNKANYIGKIFNLVDTPDNLRKKHKKSVPKIGGLVIYFCTILYLILTKDFHHNLIFIIFITFYFLLGLLDDVKNLSSLPRLVLSSVFLCLFFYINPSLMINKIFIFGDVIDLNYHFSFILIIFFTMLCVLLLENAINMIDGINALCGSFVLYSICYFSIKNGFSNIDIFIILILMVFILFNILNKTFLGNSGAYLLSSILSYKILYNNEVKFNYSAEEIYLVLIIPGLDMLRLFFARLKSGKNPFMADNNHIHHLINSYIGDNNLKTYIFTLTLMIVPGLICLYFPANKIHIIISVTIFYILLILKIKKVRFF